MTSCGHKQWVVCQQREIIIFAMRWYRGTARLLGSLPCDSSGFSRNWLFFSILFNTFFILPGHILRAFVFSGIYPDNTLKITGMAIVSSEPTVIVAHLWQLCSNKNAKRVMNQTNSNQLSKSTYVLFFIFATIGTFINAYWVYIIRDTFIERQWMLWSTAVIGVICEVITLIIVMHFYVTLNSMVSSGTNFLQVNHPLSGIVRMEIDFIHVGQRIAGFYSPQLGAVCGRAFFYTLFYTYRVISTFDSETWHLQFNRTAMISIHATWMFLVVKASNDYQRMVRNL